jgi:hypothetical protein
MGAKGNGKCENKETDVPEEGSKTRGEVRLIRVEQLFDYSIQTIAIVHRLIH